MDERGGGADPRGGDADWPQCPGAHQHPAVCQLHLCSHILPWHDRDHGTDHCQRSDTHFVWFGAKFGNSVAKFFSLTFMLSFSTASQPDAAKHSEKTNLSFYEDKNYFFQYVHILRIKSKL